MATMYRKSLSQVALSVGGIVISEGGGDGEFVSVTSPERMTATGGVHGDAILSDTPNSIYEVTVTLLEPAFANSLLQTLYNAQFAFGIAPGSYDFILEDVGTGETLSGQCGIIKEPDRGKAAEPSNYQWELRVLSATPWTYSERATTL